MSKFRGSARARRVPCRRILRGLERLESRCVLSAGSLTPTGPWLSPDLPGDRPPAAIQSEYLPSSDAFFNALDSAINSSSPVLSDYGRVVEHSASMAVSTSFEFPQYHPKEFIGAAYGSEPLRVYSLSSFLFRMAATHSSDGGYSSPPSMSHNVATVPMMEPAYAGPDQSDAPPRGPIFGMLGLPTDATGAVQGTTTVVRTAMQIATPTQVAGQVTPVPASNAVVVNAAPLASTSGHARTDVPLAGDLLVPMAPSSSNAAAGKSQPQVDASAGESAAAAIATASTMSVELAVAGAEISPASFVVNLIEGKASLADIPVSLKGVEQALQSAMVDLELLGAKVTSWVEDNQVTLIAIAVTTAAAGASAMYYLRRRSGPQAEERDDATSSNWLFVRFQTTLGDA